MDRSDRPDRDRPVPPLGPAVTSAAQDPTPVVGGEHPLPPFVPPSESEAASVETREGMPAEAAALGEVAGHLDRIAADLRSGSLEAMLARAGDSDAEPLDLLVTGYALGYVAARRGR